MRGPRMTYQPTDVVIWLAQDEVNHIVMVEATAQELDQERLESCWPDQENTRQLLNMVADVMNRHNLEFKEMMAYVGDVRKQVEEQHEY